MRFHLIPLAAALVATGAAAATPPAVPAAQSVHRSEVHADAHDIAAQAKEFAWEMKRHAHDLVAQLSQELRFEGDPAALAWVASEVGSAREIVKNAPYTAEAVSESVQVLADGNRIVREARSQLARDAQGRTRQEKKGPRGTTIYIFDPIANRSYALDPERKTALRLPRVPVPPVPPVPAAHGSAVPPVPPVPPVPSARGSRVEVAPGQVIVRRGGDGDDKEVRVEVLRIARGDGAPLAPPSLFTMPVLPRGKGETKPLGTRDFGGIPAEGTMTTHTIPAGSIGNEKPIVVSSERWFSPDLHVVVFARTVDPRAGETTYRLVNVRREEPPADLFKVPADYKGGERR